MVGRFPCVSRLYAVLLRQEATNGWGRGGGKLLPAQELQAAAKIAGANGPQDLKPAIHQVDAPAIQKNGKAASVGRGGKHPTQQLIALEFAGAGAGKLVEMEAELKIAIAQNEFRPRRLEAGFS